MRTPSLTGQLRLLFSVLVSLCATGTARASVGDTVDLAGAWAYRLDRSDEGVAGRWWREPFGDILQLPGSLASNGIGDDITLRTVWTGSFQDTSWYADPRFAPYVDTAGLKIPFFLQPGKKVYGRGLVPTAGERRGGYARPPATPPRALSLDLAGVDQRGAARESK